MGERTRSGRRSAGEKQRIGRADAHRQAERRGEAENWADGRTAAGESGGKVSLQSREKKTYAFDCGKSARAIPRRFGETHRRLAGGKKK